MKKILSVIFLLVSCHLFLITSASSHAIGQPPYFKVNGVFTDYYTVPSASLADFKLPQDSVKEPVLVNQNIEFEIDVNALPVPQEVIQKTKFIWEYGDGAKAEGLKNSHAYSNTGTYFIDIYADSGEGFEPQLLQSTAINVLPSKDYKLPESKILVNSKQAKDPLLDIIDVNFNSEISFDGSKSNGGSSQITEYFWDLGDQNSANEKSFKYKFKDNPYTVFPLLRIKTADGFIADSFIQIKDESAFSEDQGIMGNLKTDEGINWPLIIGAIVASLILAGILTWIISKIIYRKK